MWLCMSCVAVYGGGAVVWLCMRGGGCSCVAVYEGGVQLCGCV